MKKNCSIILTIAMIISCFSVFSLDTLAEDKYDDLITARKEYLISRYPKYGKFLEKADGDQQIPTPGFNIGEAYWMQSFFDACDLTVLLYTDEAQNMTFDVVRSSEIIIEGELEIEIEGEYVWSEFTSLFISDMIYITSPEIDAATNSCRSEYYPHLAAKSALRACLDYFDISKEELIAANERMQQDPDCIRELFDDILSDKEFESVRQSNGLFCRAPLEDFMIEALYLEDDEMANNLLSIPYSVYVKEFDSMVTVMSGNYVHSFFYLESSKYYDLDLTSDFMGDFINMLYHSGSPWNGYDKRNYEVSLILKDARAKQLAVQTGEELIFIPLAVVSLAAAVMIINPKRRRRFN